MTQNTSIWAPNSVQSPFCHWFSQICHTTVFAATSSTGLSGLLSAPGLGHSHHNTDLFLVYFSARGFAHCGCQLPHSLAGVARCCLLSVGIHICSPPHNSIQFWFQVVCRVCLLVNEGIQHAVTKKPVVVVTKGLWWWRGNLGKPLRPRGCNSADAVRRTFYIAHANAVRCQKTC